jgi:hypothetical protein
VGCVTVSWVSFLEAPERVVARPPRARRRTRMRVTVAAVAVAVALAVATGAAAMRAALAATPTDKTSSYAYSTVCVSQSRAEVIMFEDVGKGRIDGLCAARDGRIVHRQQQ